MSQQFLYLSHCFLVRDLSDLTQGCPGRAPQAEEEYVSQVSHQHEGEGESAFPSFPLNPSWREVMNF